MYSLLIREERIMKKIAFISTFLVATSSFSADWKLISVSQDNEEYFIDSSSIKTDNKKGIAQSWLKVVIKRNGKDLINTRALMEYDCRNQKHRYLSLTKFNSNGGVVSSTSKEDYDFRYVAPDTIAESLMLFSCRTNRILDAYDDKHLSNHEKGEHK